MTTTTHAKTGVSASSTGTTTIAHLAEVFPGASVEIERVIIEQDGAADASINVELGGNTLFNSPISPSTAGTAEGHTPDQNEFASADTDALVADVTTASGTGTSTYDVTVKAKVHDNPSHE